MKKIPKSLVIGGHRVEVKLVKRLISYKKEKENDSTEAVGTWQPFYHLITLFTDMPWSKVEEAFLHEILHAVSDYQESRLSERQVTTMAKGLYEVLKNNNISFSHREDKFYRQKRSKK